MGRRDDLDEAKRRYEKVQAQAEANLAKNAREGRSFENMVAKGTPVNAEREFIKDTAHQAQKLKENKGFIKSLQPELKVADEAVGNMGMIPELRNKSIVDKINAEVGTPNSIIKDSGKGLKSLAMFAPILKALSMGALGMGALGAGQKAMAGDLTGASADVADVATDYIPGIAQAKMALSPTSVGEGSDVVPKDVQPYDFSQNKVESPNSGRFANLRKKILP